MQKWMRLVLGACFNVLFQLFPEISHREVMPFCTFGWKGDVFSGDKPGKSDVL
jgi:hypothetical protein